MAAEVPFEVSELTFEISELLFEVLLNKRSRLLSISLGYYFQPITAPPI